MGKKIQSLEKLDKPREKLMRYGPERLSDSELMAIILGTGTKGKDVLELSLEVIEIIKSSDTLDFKNLQKIKGLGISKVSQILSIIELGKRFFSKEEVFLQTPENVYEKMFDIRGLSKEHFVVFYLDTRSKLIKREVISIGTINSALVHPREVFEPAIRSLASGIIISHNHPSKITDPSDADLEITLRLKKAGEILGIQLLDHVIVTTDKWFSFKKDNLI